MNVTNTQYGIPSYDFNWSTGWASQPVPDVIRIMKIVRTDTERRRRPTKEQLLWAPTDLSRERWTWTYEPFVYYDMVSRYHKYRSSYMLGDRWNPSAAPSTPDMMNALINEIRADVANLANSLGEYKQAAKTFTHLGSNLLYSLRAAKRGDLVQAWKFLSFAAHGSPYVKNHHRKFAGGWLQYRFGIKTVVDDIEKVIDELSGRINDPVIARVSKKTKVKHRLSKTLASEVKADVDINGFVRLTCIYEVDNTFLKTMSDHGMVNPASLFWELTYMSWVVDYVIGVGEWLQALDVPLSLKRWACWETTRIANLEKMTSFGKAGQGIYATVHQHGSARLNYVLTERRVRTLQAVMPVWKPHFSSIRIANLVALGIQLRSDPRGLSHIPLH